jgi:hypothetical protein
MPICPSCGKENIQPGGIYCSFCGSSLEPANLGPGSSDSKISSPLKEVNGESQESKYLQRLEKVTKRIDRLGYLVAAETVALAILLVFLYYTFYGL